ncbi:hypothetical protein FAGAP_1896 [Fusarium agapanthi]|uniref:Uncharacterized protein n=1 Tax=Fusarium agapanthi TaxID=1803897 RepID=A0A9P5EAL7_9HYPO|nr:hypothetical protein FAGAP_1896 [Fusarium agapanthi]
MQTYSHYLLGDYYGELWNFKPVRQNNHMYPLEFGLMVYMEEQWKNIAWVFLDCAVPAIPNLDTLGDVESSLMDRIAKDKVFGKREKRETPRSVHVLFSSAGTGKTRQIFEPLQKQWGFYLLAPNLAPTAELSKTDDKDLEGMDLIDTKRYSASRDTYTMFADHPQMIPEWIPEKTNVFRPLIVTRVALLYEFLRRYPSLTPRQWLWLQISCDTCDPFDALYRLFRLSADQYLWWDENVYVWAEIPGFIVHKCYSLLSKLPGQLFKGSLYHCFDEAQLTLDDPQAASMLSDLYATLTLIYVIPWSGFNTEERVEEDIEDQEKFRTFRGVEETGPWSRLPLLSRSGRPLPLKSSEVDLDIVEAWVRRPLEVPSTQEFLVLVIQAYRLMDSDKVSTDTPRIHLKELLENRDSEAVASLVTLSLVQLLKADTIPGADSLGLSLLELLAEHGNTAIENMASIIQSISPRVATSNTSLSGVAATLHTGLRNLHIRNMIKSHSLGQRGRYRWSTVFIEELMMLYPRMTAPGSTLSEINMIIKEAESRTTAAAIGALKGQIRKMKSAGKEELVQDLFRAGIRAEMMSSPSIFLKPNFAQLVTYGFALVQKDGDTIRYTFSEPIAVRAVMEYLRTEGGNDYQDLMLQWLVHTQDDSEVRAMLGKATECHSTVYSDVNSLIKLASQVSWKGPPNKTYKHETPGTIWDWMKQQRSGDQVSTPTFMFPDINASPDLVFLLQKQLTDSARHSARESRPSGQVNKLVIISQIKTGRGARFEDAMETLLVCNWHKNLKNGITVRQSRLQSWIRKNYNRIKANHFVCVLDKSVASSIWGNDFTALADAIRRQDSQKGKGWEQQIRKHS